VNRPSISAVSGTEDAVWTVLGLLLGSAGQRRLLPPLPRDQTGALISLAEKHHLAGLLYASVYPRMTGIFAPADIERLRISYLACLARNMRLLTEFEKVSRLLWRAGVPLIPLKGISLLIRKVYPHGAREMSDVDILVPQDRFDEVQRILAACGYRKTEEHVKNFDHVLGTHLWRTGTYLSPDGKTGGVSIDIHDRLQYFGTDLHPGVMREKMAGIWRRASRCDGMEGVSLLSPEDELLYLCVHAGLLHLPMRKVSLCDVARLVWKFPSLPWDAFEREAVRLNVGAPAYLVLSEAVRFPGIGLPDGMLGRLRMACRHADLFALRRAASGARIWQHFYYFARCRQPRLRGALLKAWFWPSSEFLEALSSGGKLTRWVFLRRRIAELVRSLSNNRTLDRNNEG